MVRKDKVGSFSDMMTGARGLPAVPPMVAPQVEQFWKMQDAVLEDAEAYSRAWFERRHDAAQTALAALHTANGEGADPAAAMQTMVEWQQRSLRRMAEDMQQWVDLWTRCAARATDAGMAAGTENLGKAEKLAASGTGSKHATPV